MKSPFSAAVAIGVGLIVLLGYFLPIPVLGELRTLFLNWAIILAAVALWVGVVNLLGVHLQKVRTTAKNSFYSVVLLLAFLATLVAGVVLGPANSSFQRVVTDVQVPVEASLMAVLAVTLAFASVRLLRRRVTPMAVLFVLAAVVFLFLGLGFSPLNEFPTLVSGLTRLPVAGTRGILLGVALGSLTTGLRILMGADRPYGG